MNKTIKVIDLLNKIAKGEILPKTILFYGKEYKLDDEYKCYMSKISEDIFDDFMDNNDAELDEFLNDTVEIIEDNDKLEKIEHFDLFDFFTGYDYGRTNKSLLKDLEMNFQHINNELAYLIDHINKIEEKLDEK